MIFNNSEPTPVGARPFPVLMQPVAVAFHRNEQIRVMGDEAAQRIWRPMRIAVGIAVIPSAALCALWTWSDGWSGLVFCSPLLLILTGLIALTQFRSFASHALTCGHSGPDFSFALAVGDAFIDVAIHDVALVRLPYAQIKEVRLLSSVILIRRTSQALQLLPRTLVSPELINHLRTSGVVVRE
ncbi:hypothetical protein [Gordonia sp. CPCC 205333]|uniref:hypothetical protein n=1 Tax=Gordonia sp. CPCC 205333 TaxID=3140790 RepID=UPI003AF4089F